MGARTAGSGREGLGLDRKINRMNLLLFFLSRLYGTAVALRHRLYRIGLLKARRLPARVISIGNLTVGGTGKTPMVIAVAQRLKEGGFRPVVLSRGYKGKA